MHLNRETMSGYLLAALPDRLRAYRAEQGLTAREMAERCAVSYKTYQGIEQGRSVGHAVTWVLIARATGVSLDEWMG